MDIRLASPLESKIINIRIPGRLKENTYKKINASKDINSKK